MSEPRREYIEISKLQPGPIQHESLPLEILERLSTIFEVVGPYLGMTLEQWEIGFMRDIHPENEVAVWCKITLAFFAYHEKFLDGLRQPDEEEKKLLAALIVISTGVSDVSKLNVPAEIGGKLLQCYEDVGKQYPSR